MDWRRIFFTAAGVWRLPWRLLWTSLTWVALSLTLGTLLTVFLIWRGSPLLATARPDALPAGLYAGFVFAATLATALTLAWAQRWWEPFTWAHWGLRLTRPAWREVAIGFAAGVLMQAAVAVALYLTGSATWQRDPAVPLQAWLVTAGWWLFVFAAVGWYEEALFRGYLYTAVAQAWGPWPGLVLSSLVFALLHGDNPAFGPRAFLGIGALAGFLVLLRRGTPSDLALPIGVHWGWNFAEGIVFGFPVSGVALPTAWQVTLTGPPWWTGGAFGPEAGAVLLVALAVGVGLLRPRRTPPQPLSQEQHPS